jgi:hypothetical protein
MNIVTNEVLGLDEVFGLLSKPRDLTKQQFLHLCHFTNVGIENIITSNSVLEVAISSGVASSNGDVKRMIKGKSLGIAKRKIQSINDTLSQSDFFETGINNLMWSTVKNGKKIAVVILIQKLHEDDNFFDE